jgi:hypothetical protein
MPNFYSRVAGPKLTDLLDELENNPELKTGLADEIALAKTMCLRAAAMYSEVCERGVLDAKVTDDKGNVTTVMNLEARAKAGAFLKETMEFQSQLVERWAKVEMMKKDKIPAANAKYLANQILRIIHKRLEVENNLPDIAKLILQDIADLRVLDNTAPKVMLQLEG